MKAQEFQYQIFNSSGDVTVSGDGFRLSSLIGGVAYSHCCTKAAVLSYRDGAFTPAAPARFDLIVYDVETGDSLLPSGTTVNSTSGSGSPDGFQEPRVFFSPDCTIVAVVSKTTLGGDIVNFYDLERTSRMEIGRLNVALIVRI